MSNKKIGDPGYFVNFSEQIPDENTGNVYEIIGDDMSNVHINRKATFANPGSQKGTPLSAQNFNDIQNMIKNYIDIYIPEKLFYYIRYPSQPWTGLSMRQWLATFPNFPPELPQCFRLEICVIDQNGSLLESILSWEVDLNSIAGGSLNPTNWGISVNNDASTRNCFLHFIRSSASGVAWIKNIDTIINQPWQTIAWLEFGQNSGTGNDSGSYVYWVKVVDLTGYNDHPITKVTKTK